MDHTTVTTKMTKKNLVKCQSVVEYLMYEYPSCKAALAANVRKSGTVPVQTGDRGAAKRRDVGRNTYLRSQVPMYTFHRRQKSSGLVARNG
jgi:hypothetical protein